MASTHDLKASRLFQVKDHVCMVTGGGTGIGLMAAQALAANAKGAKVYITGRRREALEKAAVSHTIEGGQVIAAGPCDVTRKDDLDKLVKEIESKEQHINLLVTSAGRPGPKADPESSHAPTLKDQLWQNESFEEWDDVYKADVTSVYFTVLAFLPLLQASMSGPSPAARSPNFPNKEFTPSVITISSVSGLMRHAQSHFSYNAAKAATVQLTKLMSAEFLKAQIRVNSIAPGYFPSELTAKESREDQKSELDPEYASSKGHVPIQRPGVDDEMAQAVLFLTKNRYVNGQIINVDGGIQNVVPMS